LIRYQETNLSLSNDKIHMLFTKEIFLGHCIWFAGIKVDPTKVEFISKILVPKTQKDVRRFLGHAKYYSNFVGIFTNTERGVNQYWALFTIFNHNL
jgi:hypothetical protein